jgi:hypothetical protein
LCANVCIGDPRRPCEFFQQRLLSIATAGQGKAGGGMGIRPGVLFVGNTPDTVFNFFEN